jgi:hypothetical protein
MGSRQAASQHVERPLESVSVDRLACYCVTGPGLTTGRLHPRRRGDSWRHVDALGTGRGMRLFLLM